MLHKLKAWYYKRRLLKAYDRVSAEICHLPHPELHELKTTLAHYDKGRKRWEKRKRQWNLTETECLVSITHADGKTHTVSVTPDPPEDPTASERETDG